MRQILSVLTAAILLTSCMTTEKATSFLEKKKALPQICADKFPVKDSTIVRDSLHIDTVIVEQLPESYVVEWEQDTAKGFATALPAKDCTPLIRTVTITKTLRRDSLIIRRDIARETALQFRSDSLEVALKAQLHNQEKTIAARDQKIIDQAAEVEAKQKRIWWLYAIILCLVLLLFRNPLFKLIAGFINPIKTIYPF